MNALWARYAAKLDAMAGRERMMVFVAGALLIALAIWGLAIQPLWDRNQRLTAQAAAQRDNLATLEAQKRELQARLAAGPDVELARQIEEADRQLTGLETSLTQMQSGLIEPGRMPALIKDMLGRTPRLQLVAMRTLPAMPLVERQADPAGGTGRSGTGGNGTDDAGIFKHGIEITLEGRYLDLLAYATQLEQMPDRVMWNRTRIDAHDYPRVTMTLTLYTLSLESTWLTI